jgi:hypothetical protein
VGVTESSVPAVLRARAREKPDAPVYRFIDYELDPEGYAQPLTWSQLHQRVQVAFNFPASSLKPSYGLAEAMVYVNSSGPRRPPTVTTPPERIRPAGRFRMTALVEYPNVGNRVVDTDVLYERARQQPDVDAFDAEFFEISPITEIWSKGRVGI